MDFHNKKTNKIFSPLSQANFICLTLKVSGEKSTKVMKAPGHQLRTLFDNFTIFIESSLNHAGAAGLPMYGIGK